MTDTCHVSVMPDEIVAWLGEIQPNVIVDGTYGGGGHSQLLLNVVPSTGGHVIGLDRDPAVLRRTESEDLDDRLSVFCGSYEKTPQALEALGLSHADGMVLDLGLSSDQLADRDRGFSFQNDGPLDLRFDPENGVPADEWLQRNSEKDIADAIYQFGEERFSRRIAREIVARARERSPVRTVNELVEICRRCVPRSKNHDIHPATRTFQALRIAVNDELAILQRTLADAPNWIAPGGRIAVISFHSLEDRIVKQQFRDDERWEILTRKPLRPSDVEVANNPRSRSAKLRVAQVRAM
ncbi:16S rRNA (cytosine(1402)-N(4))-methyltransferase RsmH [Stieleria varia]|uniref:Ribosomal RNA small subunit methyltransferase H n=1 Tax=Stieleria varia TaxID=2528005 RepID=A0A5C6AUJ0_9BACT|nr:Ribosomal RNA small subunit methyltransferase H [Stieleria varia]